MKTKIKRRSTDVILESFALWIGLSLVIAVLGFARIYRFPFGISGAIAPVVPLEEER